MQNLLQSLQKLVESFEGISEVHLKNERLVALLLEESGVLDRDYYLAAYPDIAKAGVDPYWHYVNTGFKEARFPCKNAERIKLPADQNNFCKFIAAFYGEIKKESEPCKTGSPQSCILRQGSCHALYDMPLYIEWELTDMCNYSCSYCFGHKKLDKNRFASMESLMNAVENMAYLNRPFYNIALSGGEPTTHPKFEDLLYLLISRLGKKINKIHIISNGSRDGAFYEELQAMAARVPISLNISVHTEYAKENHIHEIIKRCSKNMQLSFNLMYHPEQRQFLGDMLDSFITLRKQYYFSFWFSWLREPPKFDKLDSRYTQEHKDWKAIQDKKVSEASKSFCQQHDFLMPPKGPDLFWDILSRGNYEHHGPDNPLGRWNGGNKMKGMYCIAGTHSLRIGPAGNVNGIVCPEDKHVVDIFKPDAFKNDDFMRIIKCGMEHCGCAANDPVMKFRDAQEAQTFLEMAKIRQHRLLQEHTV